MATAPARIELSDPEAYRRKLKGFLGNRNPLEVLAQTTDVLASLVKDRPAATMRKHPFEGKWSPNEILGHLLDTEIVFGYRLRTILCDDCPTIIGMDQEKWVAVQRHNDREPRELLDAFRFLRNLNLGIWRRLGPEELKRFGRHDERGEESLGVMLEMEAGHDLSHIDQLKRYLAALDGRSQ